MTHNDLFYLRHLSDLIENHPWELTNITPGGAIDGALSSAITYLSAIGEAGGFCHREPGAVMLSGPDKAGDPYFAKLRSMNDDELRDELGEETAEKLKLAHDVRWLMNEAVESCGKLTELLQRCHSTIMAFMDPEGNPPEHTGEFMELKAIGEEIAAHLGIAPSSQEEAHPINQPYLDRSPFSGIEVTRGIDYSDACQPREMQATLEIGEGKLAFAAV